MLAYLFSLTRILFKKSLLICCLFVPIFASAHPHSWVDTNTYINSNDTHITSLYMTWTFDQETSEYMLQGEDTSTEHIEKTLQRLAEGVVNNMYNEHYFTYFYANESPVRFKAARYPQLIRKQDKLILSFEIPLSKPVVFSQNNFKLFIYDPTYYVDMSWLNEQEMQVSEQIEKRCKGNILAAGASQGERDYALALAADVAPDDGLGERFSQQYELLCN